jgi:hypothetical protein
VLLLVLAALLIAWGQAPERTEEFVGRLPGGNYLLKAQDRRFQKEGALGRCPIPLGHLSTAKKAKSCRREQRCETDLDVNLDGWTTIRGAPISE